MSEIETVTLATELQAEVADREITQAISARHKVARKYVMRLRRRKPDASPAEIITMLERHYVRAITVAGGMVTAGTIAANVGLSLIPGAAAGKEVTKGASKVAAKKAAKVAARTAAKGLAKNAAKSGAERVVQLIPAGDEQIQFEITAVFALGLAEVHSMRLDKDQAQALVYGLSNERVSQQQIATMATDLAEASGTQGGIGKTIATGRDDWSHWANTLADTLPGGAAQDLVRTVQTGQLETVRAGLNDSQRNVIDYGVGALVGGATRFRFGGEVVEASRVAFAEPPAEFPEHLSDSAIGEPEEAPEPNRALSALEDAAKSTGTWMTTAADMSTRAFRRVDLDGDGIPDEARALTVVKGAGVSVAEAMSSSTRVFRKVDRDGDGVADERQAVTALKVAGSGVASRLRRKSSDEDDVLSDLEGDTSVPD